MHISRSGLVTLAGGKWTTYRKMAEDAIDQAALVAGLDEKPSVTAELRIGGEATPEGLDVVRAARQEMARTVEDVLSRRTRVLFLDARAALKAAPQVAALLANELGKSEEWREAQIRDFERVARSFLPAGVE